MFGRGRQERDKQDAHGGIRHILIVEDDALIAFDNEYLLGEKGFNVIATVDTAEEALRLIAEGGIDLVVCDVDLRGQGDGIDVARSAFQASIPLLFVTGQCPAEARGFASGCLAKPYSSRDLLGSIEVIAAKRAGTKAARLPRGFTLFDG